MRIPEHDGHSFQNERADDEQTALRMVWLVFAGWWLSIAWVLVAWLCVLIVPLTGFGLTMLANITRVAAFRSPGDECHSILSATLWRLDNVHTLQRPVLLRLLYALSIGWWLSLLWAILAWAESLSIDRRPSGVARFMRLPRFATLQRY